MRVEYGWIVPWLGLVPILSFLLLTQFGRFRRSTLRVLPAGHLRWRGGEFLDQVNSVLAGYMRAQVLSALIVGTFTSVGLALLAEVLRCCAREHPIEMIGGVELRKEILEVFDQTFAVTTVLLLIALVVAGLGITTTLTVLVLERIRQLNTLAAMGAGFGQIRSMIFWEAVLMVMTGEAVGLVCGFLMAHLLIDVINLQSFGWTFLYVVDWRALLVSLPLILGTALVAALPAARLVLKSSLALVLKEP